MKNFYILRVTDNAIWIKDTCEGKSITNDAENVVSNLLNNFGNKKIYYCDTEENWDELKHDGEEFVGFNFGVKE